MADSNQFHYEHDDGMQDYSNFGKLEELFQQAKARDEEQLRRRREQVRQENSSHTGYKWVRYFMYFWVARLSIVLIGAVLPFFISLWTNSLGNELTYNAQLDEIDWKIISDFNFQTIKGSSSRSSPYIIKNSPVINSATLKLFLSSLFQTYNLPIKVSDRKEFVYYSDDRLWSKEFLDLDPTKRNYQFLTLEDYFNYSSYQFPPFPLMDSLNQKTTTTTPHQAEESPSFSHYMYIGYPHMVSYLESFAPSLFTIVSSITGVTGGGEQQQDSHQQQPTSQPSLPVQSNLWMASEGVIAHMHYDYQDNFLLQLSGQKTVLLASPEFMGTAPLIPYPSLHPLWRQASGRNISYDSLFQIMIEEKTRSRGGGTGAAGHVPLPLPSSPIESGRLLSSSSSRSSWMVWNITLSPGDILFIPSGYSHQVITGENSVSINAWLPSLFSQFHNQFLKKLSLPFLLTDSLSMKLAKLAIIMKEQCLFWKEKENCLVERMAQRYERVFQEYHEKKKMMKNSVDENRVCSLDDIISLCNPMTSLKQAGKE
jgi:hypothetical protein